MGTDKLSTDFIIFVSKENGETAALTFPSDALNILLVLIQAGLVTDPVVRDVSQERTVALHAKFSLLVSQRISSVNLSKDELDALRMILVAVNQFEPEDYYEDLFDRFPNDKLLDDIVDYVWNSFNRIFH